MPTNPPRIKPGTVTDFADSMAAAMEHAFSQEYKLLKGEDIPEKPYQDRHLLFVAIAQGVVSHLIDNLDAIKIHVTTTQVTTTQDGGNLIKSKNDTGSLEVTQIPEADEAGNVVKSSGDGTVTLETNGILYL